VRTRVHVYISIKCWSFFFVFGYIFFSKFGGIKLIENDIENHLNKEVKKLGGMPAKFVSPGLRGVPDRIVLLPGGQLVFIELKAPGEKPRKQQSYRIKQLNDLGFKTQVIDTYESVAEFIRQVR